jgi:hypothetical protein
MIVEGLDGCGSRSLFGHEVPGVTLALSPVVAGKTRPDCLSLPD